MLKRCSNRTEIKSHWNTIVQPFCDAYEQLLAYFYKQEVTPDGKGSVRIAVRRSARNTSQKLSEIDQKLAKLPSVLEPPLPMSQAPAVVELPLVPPSPAAVLPNESFSIPKKIRRDSKAYAENLSLQTKIAEITKRIADAKNQEENEVYCPKCQKEVEPYEDNVKKLHVLEQLDVESAKYAEQADAFHENHIKDDYKPIVAHLDSFGRPKNCYDLDLESLRQWVQCFGATIIKNVLKMKTEIPPSLMKSIFDARHHLRTNNIGNMNMSYNDMLRTNKCFQYLVVVSIG